MPTVHLSCVYKHAFRLIWGVFPPSSSQKIPPPPADLDLLPHHNMKSAFMPPASGSQKAIKALLGIRCTLAVFALIIAALAGGTLAGSYCQLLRDVLRQTPESFGMTKELPEEARQKLLSSWDEKTRSARSYLGTLAASIAFGIMAMVMSSVLALFTARPEWRERARTLACLPNAWAHYWVDTVSDVVLGLSFFIIAIVLGAKDLKEHRFDKIDSMEPWVALPKTIVAFEALLVVLLTAAAGLCFWVRRSIVIGANSQPMGATANGMGDTHYV